MNDPVLRRNVAELADYGWVFELQVFSNQMADAARFVAALPEVEFVLVHSGMLESAGEADVEPWSDGMQRLAELPNLVTKLTGQGTFVHRVDPDLIRARRRRLPRVVRRRPLHVGLQLPRGEPVDGLPFTHGRVAARRSRAAPRRCGRPCSGGTAERVYRL